jgi:hypothetical protein
MINKGYLKEVFSKLEAIVGSLLLTALLAIGLLTSPVPAIAQGSGTWTLTGSLNTARTGHTATLLANGQVLVAGGVNTAGAVLASAELYNPATGTWSLTGSMATARRAHTATLLSNGLVLVAGGALSTAFNGGATATAELYNPATGTWSSTGSMTMIRSGHTAVLLPGGNVLVAGGGSSSSAELYVMGAWQATPSSPFNETGNQAALLQNGQVLIAAGQSAEVYSSGQWFLTASLKESHGTTTATPLLNGDAFICGRSITFAAFCEFYNPTANTWTLAHNPGSDPVFTPLLLLGTGLVLMAGGQHSDGASNISLLYNPSANVWIVTGLMHFQRTGHTVTLLANGHVLAVGGKNGTSTALATAEVYTP